MIVLYLNTTFFVYHLSTVLFYCCSKRKLYSLKRSLRYSLKVMELPGRASSLQDSQRTQDLSTSHLHSVKVVRESEAYQYIP